MRLRYKIVSVILILIGVFLYGRCSSHKTVQPMAKLPTPDIEQVLVNPVRHTITVVTKLGSKTQTLPDRESTIDILKDGNIKVSAPQFGYEIKPFVGVYYTDGLRFGAGIDGLYFKKLDLGLGAAGGSGLSTIGFAQVSYTVFDNLRLGVVYSTQRYIGGCITVRI